MSAISVSVSPVGQVKPVHGVGQPPMLGLDCSMFSYLKDAGVPFSRLHDVGGWFGGNMFADIPNLFRDFDADPEDPESYDFTFTDILIKNLVENGVEPFFRLGVTIENFAEIKAYRIFPPKDPEKWARICEGVIAHYNEGWADGFRCGIRYWEIWNEPDFAPDERDNCMWRGTKEQFYELYDVASKHLKKRFPDIMIGGYGSCGFYAAALPGDAEAIGTTQKAYHLEFFDGFLEYIRARGSPFDFFSWHGYDDPDRMALYASYARKRLDEAGFRETLSFCDEWNRFSRYRGQQRHAALSAASMIAFDTSPVDGAMFYDARVGVSKYGSLFDPLSLKPLVSYWVFVAFNELYKLKRRLGVTGTPDGVWADAATDGESRLLLAANTDDKEKELAVPGTVLSCRVIDGEKRLEEAPFNGRIGPYSVLLLKLGSGNER
ncbi:MAG: hypothetical protein IJV00_10300 [Clostridia bacterium]|nr:hypothetical protein [Clostridia bacterium]